MSIDLSALTQHDSKDPWCLFVSGSRDLRHEHFPLVRQVLSLYTSPYSGVLLHGDGPGRNGSVGADTLAARAGDKLGYVTYGFPADWDRFNKKAGPIRNRLVTEIFLAHHASSYQLGFVAFSTGGPGTEGAHRLVKTLSQERSIPVHIEKFQVTL